MPEEEMTPDELPPAEPGGPRSMWFRRIQAIRNRWRPVFPGLRAPPAAAAPAEEPPTGEVLGRYLNKQDVLLRLDPHTQLWRRLSATPSLAAGDQLLGLPVFAPPST